MAYIRTLANGNFRADVRMKGIVKNKTFPSETFAQAWANKIDHTYSHNFSIGRPAL